MRWVLAMLWATSACADQTDWVRKLETGSVKDADAYEHRSVGRVIARGAYGLTHDAWSEVSDEPWVKAHDPVHAKRACAMYLEITYTRLHKKLNRTLTFADVYAGYRFGVTGYLRMGGKIDRLPAGFQKKVREYHVPYQRLTEIPVKPR